MYIFISLWDLSRHLQEYLFVYTYLTLWGFPRGSESLQLTHSKDLSFITSLTFHSQHRGFALTDLSVHVMLETCSIVIVSYAFLSHLYSCFMLKHCIHLHFMIMLLTYFLIKHKQFNMSFSQITIHNLNLNLSRQ
jgi:hypothetical protein